MFKPTLLSFIFTMFFAIDAFAVAGSGISYQGRIIKPGGAVEDDSSVQFKIQVVSPSSNCLMYEETQTVDMSAGEGSFALTLNGTSSTRTDAATYSLDRIFSNTLPFSFTTPACSYTPGVADGRVLSVSFKDSSMSSFEAMPAQALNYVPMALQAKAIAGFDATSLVRVQESNGTLDIVSPLNNVQYTEMLALIGGTSAQYTKAGQLGGSSLPVMGSGQVLSWDGTMWTSADPLAALPTFAKTSLPVCGANTFLKDDGAGNLTCVGVSGASGGTVTSVTAGTGLSGGTITTSGTVAIAAGGVTNTELASNAVQSGNIQDGSVTTSKLASNVNVVTTGSISTTSNVTAANISANTFSGQTLKVFETSNNFAVTIQASASLGANYTLTLPPAVGGANQVLTTNASGVLSWTTISGTTPGGAAGGDLSGTYPNPQVAKLQGTAVATTTPGSAQSMIYNGSAWAPGFVNFNNIKSSGNLLQFPTNCTASQTLTYSSVPDTFICTDITADATKLTGVLPVANGGTGSDNGSIAGTGALTFAAGGTNQDITMVPSGTGRVLMGGQVGIGTTNPQAQLDVYGTQPVYVERLVSAGGTGAHLLLRTAEGTTTPAALQAADQLGRISFSGYDGTAWNSNGVSIQSWTPSAWTTTSHAGDLRFHTTPTGSLTNSERMRISETGNVGIGMTSPSAKLNLTAGTATAGTAPLKLTAGTNLTTPEAGAVEYDGTNLYFTDGSNNRQTLATSSGTSSFNNVTTISDSAGNITLAPKSSTGAVAINSNTPSTNSTSGALQVTGGAGVSGDIFAGASINAATTMKAGTSLTTPQIYGASTPSGTLKLDGTSDAAKGYVLINSAGGNVGIGTTSPVKQLSLYNSSANATERITATASTTGAELELQGPNDGYSSINMLNASSTRGQIKYDHSTDKMTFSTVSAGSQRMTIDSSGNVGIGTTSPSYPLDVAGAIHSATGLVLNPTFTNTAAGYAASITTTKMATTSGTYYNIGLDTEPKIKISSGVTDSGYWLGSRSYGLRDQPTDAGTLASLEGIDIAYGHYNALNSSAVTSNAYGIVIAPYHAAGTITNSYGVLISSPATGGTVTNEYGIYQASSTAKNYFNGNIGIGSVTPSSALTVNAGDNGADLRLANTIDFGGAQDLQNSRYVHFVATSTGSGTAGTAALLSEATITQSVWRLVLRGNFYNNYEGSALAQKAGYVEVTSSNPVTSVGGVTLTFSKNASNQIQVQASCASGVAPRGAGFKGWVDIIPAYTAGKTSMEISDGLLMTGNRSAIIRQYQNTIMPDGATYDVGGITYSDQYLRDMILSDPAAYMKIRSVNTNGSWPTAIRGTQIEFGTADGADGQGTAATTKMYIKPNGQVVTTGDLIVGAGAAGTIHLAGSTVYDVGTWLHLGSGNVYSDGTFYTPSGGVSSSSDRRLKTKIEPIADGLDKIMQLEPVTFDWKNPDLHGQQTRAGGFIAQDLAKVFPAMVSENDCRGNDCSLVKNNKEFDVTWQPVFFGYIVKAIQELKTQLSDFLATINKAQEHTLRELASVKSENEKLKQENISIKAYLCEKDPGAKICK